MTLSPGMRLGPYEVVAPLGAGGMGEVWKARDPRLRRYVAVKVLPAEVAADPGRLARQVETPRGAPGLIEDPTRSRRTEPGTVLGTVGHMAPERVRGERTDSRSDILA